MIYDIIVIGCGSAGLSVGMSMNKFGFKVVMISPTDHKIGGECLNDGCVPSKAFIHLAKIAACAKEAELLGLKVTGKVDINKATAYIRERQDVIRAHEDAAHLEKEGIKVVLGVARFSGEKEVEVNGQKYNAKKIVIATGSSAVKLKVPGVDQVEYYDNENIFSIEKLPERLLVVGGGPVGIEMAQTLTRLGSKVTVVNRGEYILNNDDASLAKIVQERLESEGTEFIANASVESFPSATEAVVMFKNGQSKTISFDAIYVGIGRELNIDGLQLENAGIKLHDNKIVVDKRLRTSNKSILVCGDVAGDLQFSHAAEFHATIILNNFFNPFKRKLHNTNMSWVTFTQPELASFGWREEDLKEKDIAYEKLEQNMEADDRAITDDYRYGKLILYISPGGLLKKQRILGGAMAAPTAGEMIQELILVNKEGLSINTIFNKLYPYPTASRINQKAIRQYKAKLLTDKLKKLLQFAYKILG